MEQIVTKGEVERGFIGISAQDLSPDLAEALNVKAPGGAVIVSIVKGSPAEEAGLQPGDVIVTVNRKEVRNANDVRNLIGLLPVGEKITFEFYREGKKQKLTARLVSSKEFAAVQPDAANPRLEGITFKDIDAGSPYFGRVEGVEIADIDRNSLGWQSGLRQGDVITSVNREPVANTGEFYDVVSRHGGSLLMRIVRGNSAAFLVLR